MKILDKFKRKNQEQGQPNTVENGDYTKPEALSQSVKNEKIEPGMPLNLNSTAPNNMRKVLFAGVGILAAGVVVSGLIGMTGGSEEAEASQPQAASAPETTKGKNFDRDKAELALLEQQAASEAAPEGVASEAKTEAASQAQPAGGQPAELPGEQPELGTLPADGQPKQTPQDRKMSGNVMANLEGDMSENTRPVSLGSPSSEGGQLMNASGSGLFSDAEGNSTLSGNSGNGFGSRLNATTTASVKAQQRGDLTYLLAKGTNIRCGLDTKIVTTQPGFTRCIVSKDVYSANGKTLLIERGSKIIGEQTSALLQGQARVFVLWNELETPSGVKVPLASPGAGALGESGHAAYVKYHFWRRFGGALMISMIGDAGDAFSNRQNRTNGNNNHISYENTQEAAQQLATEALKNSINIPPTGTINQGTLINIMVARDVDFSNVYELVNPYGY